MRPLRQHSQDERFRAGSDRVRLVLEALGVPLGITRCALGM
jgi:hypothetical protein